LKTALVILRVLEAGFDVAALLNYFVGGFFVPLDISNGLEIRKRGWIFGSRDLQRCG